MVRSTRDLYGPKDPKAQSLSWTCIPGVKHHNHFTHGLFEVRRGRNCPRLLMKLEADWRPGSGDHFLFSPSLDKTVSHLSASSCHFCKRAHASSMVLENWIYSLPAYGIQTMKYLAHSSRADICKKQYGGISSIFFEVYFSMTGKNRWQMVLENVRINEFTKDPTSFLSPVDWSEWKTRQSFLAKS